MSIFLLFLWITSQLPGLRCICHWHSHSWRFSRPCCREASSSDEFRRQSSANSLAVPLALLGRSFMNTKNSPRTVHWGIPDVTGAMSDYSSSATTFCVRFSKKLSIQLNVDVFTLKWCSLVGHHVEHRRILTADPVFYSSWPLEDEIRCGYPTVFVERLGEIT